ncbi:Outer membrane receptor proteins, mostly Fe transport [Flavobacterium gillisiae]|uniref:Outer membrane receptor proteins, mostly Fe transport n=1 Tax=Flavobacterium gillisiae TaxID=150146 RepID=A0A1H4E6L5_9FLAO|nr:TonB-dependent receptor [Flavobacterium gillisiae]SEA80457.1 Outer membrane receptor proteins, mostly Fe transport [Flavobacterium gillisiae]
MKLKLFILTLFISTLAFSQTKGTITGVLTDKDSNNETLPFANVLLKGTQINGTTDIDGKYALNAPAGNYIIQYSFIGYESIEVPVTVKSGETITLSKALGSSSYKLDDVVITTTVNKQKETALLMDQKNAVEIKQSIGSQELSRKGVSDVATAVTKTSGITKQEGSGNIFVRGLGDRYNSTTMNGLPIPSNDPEKKNLNLEIFSTDIVEYISIDKVYSGNIYGDFAGGNVDIISKDYKGKGFLKIDIGSKVNTNAIAEDNFKLQKGFDGFGFTKKSIPNNPLTQFNYSSLQMKDYTPIASSFGISGGKSFDVGSEGKLSFFATASFNNDFSAKSNGTAKASVNGNGIANKNFDNYSELKYETNTTGMANIGYKINNNNKVSFNSLYINTSTQSKEEYSGYIVDIANDGNGLIRRFNYEKNSLWINQILGESKIGDRSKLNWGVSYNIIDGSMPDRVQNIFRKEATGYQLSSISAPDNHRYFQKLKEDELAGNASYDYKFNKNEDGDYNGKITVGYNGRIKSRGFQATQFNIKATSGNTNTIVDPNNLDLFYNQDNFNNGNFSIATFRGNSQVYNALDPQTYGGDQTIHAAFANTEYKFNKLTAVLGLRGEQISQKVSWYTQLGGTGNDKLEKTAFLPSLIMKYELNDKQNLRLGLSKTYTLPQFKERALFVYEEVLQVKVGNPFLYESDDYNLDLKWEMFPKSDELISVTAFGKYILNPMNEVTISSSSNDISYINTGDYGYVAGAEVEYRKQLFDFDSNNAKKLSAGINASYLYSNQELNAEKVNSETNYQVDFTNSKSKFTGASDLLLNADLTLFNEWNNRNSNLTTTVAYTYFSDRVNAIGTSNKGDLVDKAFGSLDFIAKSKLTEKLGLGLVAKNLLNPAINRVQANATGDVNVLSYKKGATISLSLNYQF